uniref:hypothetical protein n=1 Tax=Limnohabitans sp. TaxID=1907725 RepID=UPI004048C360
MSLYLFDYAEERLEIWEFQLTDDTATAISNFDREGVFLLDPSLDPEYENGSIKALTGPGSDFFKKELTVNGVRIVIAGDVGGQAAVPDEFAKKVARMFKLFTDPTGSNINSTAQRNFIKTLSGDAGTAHAGVPTLQRLARGGGADYSPNFLDDAGIASWNLSPLFDSHMANDMVWYLNSSGDGYGIGEIDAQEVIEHVFHTLHMCGLDSTVLKMYPEYSEDWQSGELFAAMEEAYNSSMWNSEGYGGAGWKTSPHLFEVAAKEYLYLLNFSMFGYTGLWKGDSLAPEWNDDMRTEAGIKNHNPLGYALHNTHIAPVISRPTIATINGIFGDGNTPNQDNPALAGVSNYFPSPVSGTSLDSPAIATIAGESFPLSYNSEVYDQTTYEGVVFFNEEGEFQALLSRITRTAENSFVMFWGVPDDFEGGGVGSINNGQAELLTTWGETVSFPFMPTTGLGTGRANQLLGQATSESGDTAFTFALVESKRASMTNISTRGWTGGGQKMIAGTVVDEGHKLLLIRAVGPTLSGFGVSTAHPDPRITLFEGQTELASNDDWAGVDIANAAARVGAFPLSEGSKDACLLVELAEGAYTIIVEGDGDPGEAIVEIYEVR